MGPIAKFDLNLVGSADYRTDWGLGENMRWLLPILVLACSFVGAQDLEDSFFRYTYRLDGLEIRERGVFRVRVPSFAEIERDRYRFNDYPQFIDYLLQQAPSLKNHFILLHHSQSLQLASVEHPRVILFDGGMMLAFAEHPENRQIKVEILESDPQTYELRPREIVFGQDGIEFRHEPKACVSCHGKPAKPLWDPYDFWPNAFGAAVGQLHTQQEKDAYVQLKANALSSPLLSRLQLKPQIGIGHEENTAFTQYIHQINLGQWMKREFARVNLSAIRYPLVATFGACFTVFPRRDFEEQKRKILEFLPGLSSTEIARLDAIYLDVVQARSKTKQFQDQLVATYFPAPIFLGRIDHERLGAERGDVALVRWLLDLAGVDAANLSTSHIANDYLFSSPSFFLLDALMVLREIQPELFEGLSLAPQDLHSGIPAWLKVDCAELQEKSLAARQVYMARASLWRPHTQVQFERPPIARCAKCHTEGFDAKAPPIPFEDTRLLAHRLRTTRLGDQIIKRIESHGEDQMPPGRPLSAGEIESMKEFIRVLR